jgi:hypothetical protein
MEVRKLVESMLLRLKDMSI